MSDILGETDGLGLVLYSGTRDDLQAKLRKRDDEITRLRSLLKEAGEALDWYGEQTRLCRLIHSEGDAGRNALADDGGSIARTVLSKIKGET